MTDFAACFGDTLSLGITKWIRSKNDTNKYVDFCSDPCSYGKYSGFALDLLMGGKALWGKGGKLLSRTHGVVPGKQLIVRPLRQTPGGRTLRPHAELQATKGASGRRPMSMKEIDQVLDHGNVIKKIDMNHPGGPTVTIQNTRMPGQPQVVVDAETGKRVVTVLQPNSTRTRP